MFKFCKHANNAYKTKRISEFIFFLMEMHLLAINI